MCNTRHLICSAQDLGGDHHTDSSDAAAAASIARAAGDTVCHQFHAGFPGRSTLKIVARQGSDEVWEVQSKSMKAQELEH